MTPLLCSPVASLRANNQPSGRFSNPAAIAWHSAPHEYPAQRFLRGLAGAWLACERQSKAMGQNPNRTPSEHPIPTNIGSKIWVVNSPTPKWDPIGFDPQPNDRDPMNKLKTKMAPPSPSLRLVPIVFETARAWFLALIRMLKYR